MRYFILMVLLVTGMVGAATYYVNGSTDLNNDGVESAADLATGTAQAGGATTITLAADASATTDFYVGFGIQITSGTGMVSNNTRKITAYDKDTKVATVAAWATNPASGDTYKITVGSDTTNTGGAATKNNAWATIQKAITSSATGTHTVLVTKGTYYEPTTGRIYLSTGANSKTLTITAESGTVFSNWVTQHSLIYSELALTSVDLTFENFIFDNRYVGAAYGLRLDASSDSLTIKFKNCTMSPNVSNTSFIPIYMNSTATNPTARNLYIENCDFVGTTTPVYVNDLNTLSVTDGTTIQSTTATNLITLIDKIGTVSIDDVAFTGIYNASTAYFAVTVSTIGALSSITMSNFTVSSGGGINLPCYTDIDYAINIQDATLNVTAPGILIGGNGDDTISTITNPILKNIYVHKTSAKSGHGVLIGKGCVGAYLENVVSLNDTDDEYGFVSKSDNTTFVNCTGTGRYGICFKGAQYNSAINCTFVGASPNATNDAAYFLQDNFTGNKDTKGTTLSHCIFYAPTGQCIVGTESTTYLNAIFNDNCYYSTNADYFSIDATGYTPTKWIDFWETNGVGASKTNDSSSVFVNPTLSGPDANGVYSTHSPVVLSLGAGANLPIGSGGRTGAVYNGGIYGN